MTTNYFNELLKDIGNEKSFNILFDELYPQIIKISIYLYGDKENARDVAQEIFKYLLTHEVKTYIENPRAWLFALCKYNGQKLFKKELVLNESIDLGLSINEFISLEMQLALSKLDPDETDLLILIWYYGFSIEEVAEIVHKSYNAVAKQHERVKKKLKNILSN